MGQVHIITCKRTKGRERPFNLLEDRSGKHLLLSLATSHHPSLCLLASSSTCSRAIKARLQFANPSLIRHQPRIMIIKALVFCTIFGSLSEALFFTPRLPVKYLYLHHLIKFFPIVQESQCRSNRQCQGRYQCIKASDPTCNFKSALIFIVTRPTINLIISSSL